MQMLSWLIQWKHWNLLHKQAYYFVWKSNMVLTVHMTGLHLSQRYSPVLEGQGGQRRGCLYVKNDNIEV